jgi:predicted kinase
MPVLHIPVAIPGAGKSYLAGVMGATTVSTDAIRLWLTKDESNQDRNGDVFKHFHEQIDYALRRGHNVYADATNLTGRSDLRKIAESVTADYHARINPYGRLAPVRTHLILFKNIRQALSRNAQRERVVPEEVMLHMLEKYERALMDINYESYDFVTEVSATR